MTGLGRAGALLHSGAGSNDTSGGIGDGGGRPELVPVCSGALALRRITSLLASARRADAQGEYHQACELYAEVLTVQRTLSRAPLGSIGKSLRDAAAGVEVRLQQLRQELGEADSTTCSGSRPATNCSAPSSSSKTSAAGVAAACGTLLSRSSNGGLEELSLPYGSSWASRLEGQTPSEFAPQALGTATSCWDAAPIPECPLSARDTSMLEAMRPCTQDGARRHNRTAEGRRPTGMDGDRPSTRDKARLQQPSSLDGTRPSTRDDARVQQMISGARRAPAAHEMAGQRPQTRDGVRPPTRDGVSGRGQDVSIRKLTSRGRRRHHQHAAEAAGPEAVAASPSPESLGPCFDADESVELLE
mmetsp:Transcript_67653/g.218507  ORF Transcript_67653/g.218507 Transcript_67653/m.218507 type:complete len:359 (-) Transcript_67653:142-1218(-)